MLQELVYIVSGLGILFYVYMTWNFDYWKKKKIPGPTPRFLLGNLPSDITQKRHLSYEIDELYKEYKNRYGYIGIWSTKTPTILPLTPEIIKDILVRNFRSFCDNTFSDFVDKRYDPMFARNPFMLKGDDWKEARAEITPAFTPNKIKTMYPIIEDVCGTMKKYIQSENQKKTDGLESRQLSIRYTTDVVANCIFGVDAESFVKEEPIIRQMGKKISVSATSAILYTFVLTLFPPIRKIYKLNFIPKIVENFFEGLLLKAIENRHKSHQERGDFLQYLMELKVKKNLSDLVLVSHALTIFYDGFETTSCGLSFMLYAIARNKSVQDKLRNEIRETIEKHGKITYDILCEMPYLDQVFMESLRMYPPGEYLSKITTEKCELELTKGEFRNIDVGTYILIPIYSIHHDTRYYSKPDEFIPERFDPENGGVKSFRDKGILIPFGDGPRMCLGYKYAQVKLKAAIVSLVRDFDMSVNSKTSSKILFDPKDFMLQALGGLWLDFNEL